MKYEKPEIIKVKIETNPIANTGIKGWLDGTAYEGTENFITDWFMGNS